MLVRKVTEDTLNELTIYMQNKKPKNAGKKRKSYVKVIATCDIETSNIVTEMGEKFATMYAWAMNIDGVHYLGRTWQEFIDVIDAINGCLSDNDILIFWIHNLSYEFAFMKALFEWDKVFALKSHRVLYATTNHVQFRCSYLLSGKSLKKIGDDIGLEKLDLDYVTIRHSDTPMSDTEIDYLLRDVDIVSRYIRTQLDEYKTFGALPLTKTGRVRNHCRSQTIRVSSTYRGLMEHLQMSADEYAICKAAFQGGFTHASCINAYMVHEKCESYDEASAYPAAMVLQKYPMSRGEPYTPTHEELVQDVSYCYIFPVIFNGIKSRYPDEHLISSHKCRNVKNSVLDNGRIVSADSLEITITNVDYLNYLEWYEWDSCILGEGYRYFSQYLPKEFIKCVLELYAKKVLLKGVKGKEYELKLIKEDLNSLYGMICTDIVRDEFFLTDDGTWDSTTPDVFIEVEKYNKSKNRFLFYPWGLFVTAHARRALLTTILKVVRLGKQLYLYGDTDSIKMKHDESAIKIIKNYNKQIDELIKKSAAFYHFNVELYKPNGKTIGIFEKDGEYKKFKTLGAKRYMYTDTENNLHTTVAGLSKTDGLNFIKRKKDPYAFFTNDMEIPAENSGRKVLTYCDTPSCAIVTDYLGNQRLCEEQSFVHMAETGYNLSLTKDYILFLNSIGIDFSDDECYN